MRYDDNKKEIEIQSISALIQYPEIFADIDGIIRENFYSIKLNEIIFSIIKNSLLKREPLDKFTIANKINNLGLKFEIDPYSYLESLELRQVSKDAAPGYFKELAQIYAKKQIDSRLDEIRKYIHNSKNDSFNQVISKCDYLYGDVINSFSLDGEPEDLFNGTKEYIEELGNLDKPNEITCPYPIFQKFYGGFSNSTLTLFVASYKVGKSTFLLDLMTKICSNDPDMVGLYIDTEMKTVEVKRRLVSMLSGVNEYYLRNGWRRDAELVKNVRKVWPVIEKWFNRLQHLYVANISQEETESIIRRWVWKKKAENPNCKPIVFYDYFKLTDQDSVRDGFASSMVLGVKVDRTKKLSAELDIPIIAAAQSNAAGEVGLSREVPKFVDNAFKLRKRNIEEIESEGGLATHKIESICNRSLGPESQTIETQVKIGKDKEGKTIYRDNAILYKFQSFKVYELNTLQEQMNLQMLPKKKQENSGDLF
ncbi:DnaB-like helicase C-terminal domain-containing protein [Flavobacterium sp.]|uniref:DnaB-like helicase C-terminal domain-containing protein n=1 Tax=Flavobacterium sp. TaxID=239 RepID=UPI0038FC2FED